jgi:TonB-linked SusC/RagA family outer membrane protein
MKKLLFIIVFIGLGIANIYAQLKISGQVIDVSGNPIPGANVVIKGTAKGTITDINGNYILEGVTSGNTLVFSFLGYQTQEVVVTDKTVINIKLTESITNLDDVVVIGYGSVKRANLTGSVTDISSKDIQDIPAANLSSALEGKLAGVRVNQVSGRPGATTSFQIRESSSNKAAEEPLYVIDGIVRDKESFDMLDQNEVESISILKDASAAVYGVRSAGGVVLVQTKKGKEGKTKVNYSYSFGLTEPINITEMLSAYEHARMLNDGYDIEGRRKQDGYRYTEDELAYFRDSLPNGGYDWLKNAWKNATVNRHNINLSGGTDKISYFIGGNYYRETGNIENLYVNKYTIRSSITAEMTKWLSSSVEVSVGNKKTYIPLSPFDTQSDFLEGTFKALLQNPKWVPPVINGLPVKQGNMIANNPYSIWENGFYNQNESNTVNLTANATIKVPFIKGLSFKFQISQTKNHSYGKKYQGIAYGYSFMTDGGHDHIILVNTPTDSIIKEILSSKSLLEESAEQSIAYQYNSQMNFSRTFGKHDIEALLVAEISEANSNRVGWANDRTQNILGYDKEWAFLENYTILSTNRNVSGDMGYVGRLNYNYAQKYLTEFSFRYEASVKFPPQNRWGFFPSFLAAWVISEENFFKNNIKTINFLKLRGSAGILGNDATLNDFQYILRYKPDVEKKYLFGSQPIISIIPQNDAISNEEITWQTTTSYNGGIDMRMFDSKISLSFDGFYKYTDKILDPFPTLIPTTVGLSVNNKVAYNYGIVHAYGYEIELGYNNKTSFQLEYGIKGNFSWAEARKLKVAQSPGAVGKWYDELKNYKDNQPGAISSGIIRDKDELNDIMMDNPNYTINNLKPELGMLNYVDIRGTDGTEGPNGNFNFAIIEDRTVIAKHTSPTYYYGSTLFASWKGLKIETTLSGKFGNKVFFDKEAMALPTATTNVPAFWSDHWTADNPDAAYPRAYNYGLVSNYSTFWMRDGHILRLTDLNVSYILPASWAKKIDISQFRLFFTTKYLFTFLNPLPYKDADLSRYNSYPMTRSYNLGINLNF